MALDAVFRLPPPETAVVVVVFVFDLVGASRACAGYGDENDNTVIELTYNYGKTEYSKGNAYAQVSSGERGRVRAAWLAWPGLSMLALRRPRRLVWTAQPTPSWRRGVVQVAISTSDVYKSAEQIKAAGGKVRPPIDQPTTAVEATT